MQPTKEIGVLTAGMDGRKQAILRMAFRMHNVHTFVLVEDRPELEPTLAIVDVDGVDGMAVWDEFRHAFPALPAAIVTVCPVPDAPAPVLAKPVRVESLFPLLRQLLASPAPTAAGSVQPVVAPRVASVAAGSVQPAPPPPPRVQEEYPWPAVIERFDPGEGLLGTLLAIRDRGDRSMVTVDGRDSLIVLPAHGRVALLCGIDILHEACTADAVRVESRPYRSEDRPYEGRFEICGLSALLWQVTLWTCRGRLPHGVDADAPLRLRHWPNLTRLAPIPNALRIAALLARYPATLQLLVRMLNVRPADAFEFVAAAHSIGLLEAPEQRNQGQAGGAAGMDLPKVNPPRNGLLSRLLRKVVGL